MLSAARSTGWELFDMCKHSLPDRFLYKTADIPLIPCANVPLRRAQAEKERENLLKKIWNLLTWLLVLSVVLLAVALVGVRVIGFTPYAILSPSMTPQYQVGDLVYVRSTPPEEIQAGDVITFVANEDLLVVTHRVESADRENRWFITKGDANNTTDLTPVLYENVLGTVGFSLPKLGYLSMYLSTPSGRYAGIAAALTLLLLFLLPELFTPAKKEEKTDPRN